MVWKEVFVLHGGVVKMYRIFAPQPRKSGTNFLRELWQTWEQHSYHARTHTQTAMPNGSGNICIQLAFEEAIQP